MKNGDKGFGFCFIHNIHLKSILNKAGNMGISKIQINLCLVEFILKSCINNWSSTLKNYKKCKEKKSCIIGKRQTNRGRNRRMHDVLSNQDGLTRIMLNITVQNF